MISPQRYDELTKRVNERFDRVRTRFMNESVPSYTDGQKRTIANWVSARPDWMNDLIRQHGGDSVDQLLRKYLGT